MLHHLFNACYLTLKHTLSAHQSNTRVLITRILAGPRTFLEFGISEFVQRGTWFTTERSVANSECTRRCRATKALQNTEFRIHAFFECRYGTNTEKMSGCKSSRAKEFYLLRSGSREGGGTILLPYLFSKQGEAVAPQGGALSTASHHVRRLVRRLVRWRHRLWPSACTERSRRPRQRRSR